MPRSAARSIERLRRARTSAQLLDRPPGRAPSDLIRNLLGVQSQVSSSAAVALCVRTTGLTLDRVDRARHDDRSVVLAWAMRGTLHLISTEDFGWLVPTVVEPRKANARRRLRQEGVSPDQSESAVRHIERMLDREGPLTRREIDERLRRRRIRTDGQAMAHLMWLAAAEKGICIGPERDREPCYVLIREWAGEPEGMDPEVAMTELAVRYLAAHGPARPEDLAFWSGIRLGDARRAWGSIHDRLVEVDTPGGVGWRLRSAPAPAPSGLVRLLPAFDEYLLGWRDRTVVVPPEHRTQVNRGGGWIHPVVVADGRAMGTWSSGRRANIVRLEVRPFARPSASLRRKVADEANRFARLHGATAEVAWLPGQPPVRSPAP